MVFLESGLNDKPSQRLRQMRYECFQRATSFSNSLFDCFGDSGVDDTLTAKADTIQMVPASDSSQPSNVSRRFRSLD